MKSSNELPPHKVEPPASLTTTASTNVAKTVSAGSCADYTCYTICCNDDEVFAIVIETKTDQSWDALAQVHPQSTSLSLPEYGT